MTTSFSNPDPSRKILDQMMADCDLTVQEQQKMHQTLAGIFSSVRLIYTQEENFKRLKEKWANKALYKNHSYATLFEHASLDSYISTRVDELLTRREHQVKNLGHSP